jgi:phosphonoacetaldehyde hydrolase
MGLEKKEHIRRMCQLPEVRAQWEQRYGRSPMKTMWRPILRIDRNHDGRHHRPIMPNPSRDCCRIVDGMRNAISKSAPAPATRTHDGALVPAAAENGYSPDCVVCSSDVPAGRPFPWMCYQNAIRLQVYPFAAMIKIGDTISDIQEGAMPACGPSA